MEQVATWINQYGYLVLFLIPMLELIVFGLPVELMMSYAGYLVFMGKLNWLLSILTASSGSVIGMSLAYFIGNKLGNPFFKKYGHYLHLGPEKLERTANWSKKYGSKLVIMAYFIPGVRHITGYFSGINRNRFRTYFIFAYTGALLWVTTFISLGKLLGPQWEEFHVQIKKYLIIVVLGLAVLLLVYYLFKKYRGRFKETALKMLDVGIMTFHSLGRIRVLVVSVAVAFLFSFFVMLGMIQDYLANEFVQFDKIVTLLVGMIFSARWRKIMNIFVFAGSNPVLIYIFILTFLWILVKGKNRWLELLFLIVISFAGKGLAEGLNLLFAYLGSNTPRIYTFPGESAFMVVIIYGFFIYMLIRYFKRVYLQIPVIIIFIIHLFFIGLGILFFKLQYPSNLVAGYVFGGVWLSLNIILLEIFRLLHEKKIEIKPNS